MLFYLSYCFIIIGLISITISIIGIQLLPDFFCKMHAATIGDVIGCPLIIIGIAISSDDIFKFLKLIILCAVILIINPTSSYLLNLFAIREEENLKVIGKNDK